MSSVSRVHPLPLTSISAAATTDAIPSMTTATATASAASTTFEVKTKFDYPELIIIVGIDSTYY